jgi:hypothetical protein
MFLEGVQVTREQVDDWCPLARSDLGGILHANIAEVCIQLNDIPAAVHHAMEAIRLCPTWERGYCPVRARTPFCSA